MADDAEEKMLRAVAAYLEGRGWKVLVISARRIQGPVVVDQMNYELVIRFTGTQSPAKQSGSIQHRSPILRLSND